MAGMVAAEDGGAARGGLVAVHAHPDDETLSTGALLATWAAAGLPVTVVTATRGERGEVIPAALAHLEGDGPALAVHRSHELSAALAALGVRSHAYLDTLPSSNPAARGTDGDGGTPGTSHQPHASHLSHMRRDPTVFEDSGMVWVGAARAGAGGDVPEGAFVGVPLDEAADRLAALLREREPAVVVTYDPEGGYGHPDHVRVHQVTMRAVDLWGGNPTVLWRRAGRAALAAAYRSLSSAERGSSTRTRQSGLPGSGGSAGFDGEGFGDDELAVPDPAGPFPAVAVDDDGIDLAVDVLPVRDRVLAALRAHGTQVRAVEPVDGDPALVGRYALSNGVLAPLLPTEGYVHVTGPAPALPSGVRRLP